MTRTTPITFIVGAALTALVALAVAGCGGGATVSPARPTTPGGQAATIGAADTGLGKILVDSKGRTLYLFKKDSGTSSACIGACAGAWPPLQAKGKPAVGSGAKASVVTTTRRSDGTPQLTYNGHPLYLFRGDHKPGDTNGQGTTAFGGGWYALSSAGNEVSAQPPNPGGGGGY